jgi:hypothetical protein
MRFDVLESKLKPIVSKFIRETLPGKCSNHENVKILSELVRKLKQSELPEFSEIEKRIVNILFLKIFSENKGCLVVFERLNESLNNMNSCLELLAAYAAKVNSSLTDEIMKKYYPVFRDTHFEWQEDAKRYIPRCTCTSDNKFKYDLNFIIQDLKEKLDEKSKIYFIVFQRMNCVIEQVQESIQMMKSCNLKQLLEIIFSRPDELFLDFKSKIRELLTKWSNIQDKLLNFVEFEFSELESFVDDKDDEQFEQQHGSSEDLELWKIFKFHNSGQDDEKTKLVSALELVRINYPSIGY